MNQSNRKRSRPRGKDSTEETLRGKNREMQKQIRQLQKRIYQLEKQLAGRMDEKQSDSKGIEVPQVNYSQCQNCGKGELTVTVFPIPPNKTLIVTRCNMCDFEDKKRT